jgi:alpha-1,6-mannosyltransferase
LKICDLTQFYSPFSGGVKRYLGEKRKHANASGHEHLLIIPGEKTERLEGNFSRTYSIRSPLVSKTSRYRALLNLHAVEEILLREQPDIIESSDPYQIAWKAIASGKNLRIPVVAFYHSHFPEAYLRTAAKFLGSFAADITIEIATYYVRALYNRFDCTFVPSHGLAEVLSRWGVENVVLNELGVSTDVFRLAHDRDVTRTKLNIPSDKTLLIYVGRLASEKNVKTLFQSFKLLCETAPNRFHLLIVGDGRARETLLELRKQTNAVTWLQYCSNENELAKFYRAADLFVHPSVQETFGLVTLESQACGTPVVGIRGSYMDRIIFADQTHWAAQNHPESLATAIVRMSQTDLDAIGAKASRIVTERYSWSHVFERMFKRYAKLAL